MINPMNLNILQTEHNIYTIQIAYSFNKHLDVKLCMHCSWTTKITYRKAHCWAACHHSGLRQISIKANNAAASSPDILENFHD